MNRYISRHIFFTVGGILIGVLLFAANVFAATLQQSQRSGAELHASFQYMLSNFSGPVPSQWARVAFDPERQELYTLNPGLNDVRIFNPHGMEIFAFGADGDLVSAVDIASGDDGTIYILARNFARDGVQVLDYRGQPEAVIQIKDLPEAFSGFAPNRMEYRAGYFYLLDAGKLQIIVIDSAGIIKQHYDLTDEFNNIAGKLDPEQKKKLMALEISGFGVGPKGQLYLTVPVLFSAYRLKTDGTLEEFGASGSGPGKFGVVSGITADSKGNIYVADRLRSVVLIFNQDFLFLGEFGYRGALPQDMLVPDDLVLDEVEMRIFVSQAANKGVGVYKISLLQTK